MFKVLIMCQRKKSYNYEEPINGKMLDALSVDITVKKIEQYVYDYYKSRNVTIEYLTEYNHNELYDADYKMRFEPRSKKTEISLTSYEFIKNHRDYYDMVMLQTCPLMLFKHNFKYLPLIMKPNAVLTIKAFNPYEESTISRILTPFIMNVLLRYFDIVNEDTYKIICKED
jgi:hypothetical protein